MASSRSFLRSVLDEVANKDGKDIHSSRSFLLLLNSSFELSSTSFSTHSSSLDEDDLELLLRFSFFCFLLFFFDFLSCFPLNYIISYLQSLQFTIIYGPLFCLWKMWNNIQVRIKFISQSRCV